MKGYLALVLHAHLPYVRHPEYEEFLEEDWLYEAITETYLPILAALERIADDHVPCRVTLTLTPPLVSMLRDELLMGRYEKRLDSLVELGELEVRRTAKDASLRDVARFYLDRFTAIRKAFVVRYRRDLVAAFRRLQDQGILEIITCGATHAFLPLLQIHPEAVRAQITVAAAHYRQTFGRDPVGIWLPECGYFPGVERFLAQEGIRYFFVDGHGILDATPRPRYGVYAPIFTPSGTAAFGRDPESSHQVWSSEEGYPGDPFYRDFYRDIGYDLPFDVIGKYVQPTGARKHTGFKYHRITGKTEHKKPYVRQVALERAASHAGHFMYNRERQIEYLAATMQGRKPIVVSPYDAELFGHWWFEGPDFLDYFIRKVAFDQDVFRLATPSDFLRETPDNQFASPPLCSWGAGGYASVWLDPTNEWIYRHVHKATERMIGLAKDFPDAEGLVCRALNQAARELLLLQSSDWAFIMKTGTMVEYAHRRTKDHVLRFTRLFEQIRGNAVDEAFVTHLEGRDRIFPELDYRVYRPLPQ
jgi:1,4-alpha-glucan branching enzyme